MCAPSCSYGNSVDLEAEGCAHPRGCRVGVAFQWGAGPRPEARRVWESSLGAGHVRASQTPCLPCTACERGGGLAARSLEFWVPVEQPFSSF